IIWPPPAGSRPRRLPPRRGRITGPLTPGGPPVTPIVPGPLRATRRPPAGRARPVRLQRALAPSAFVPPPPGPGPLTAATNQGAALTAALAAAALPGSPTSGGSAGSTAARTALTAATAPAAATGGTL